MKNYSFDLIFCDFQFFNGNTIGILKSFAVETALILITPDHLTSFESYEINLLDCLEKPLCREQFRKVMAKILQFIAGKIKLKHDVQLPDYTVHNESLENILINRYNLSRAESAICCSITDGMSASEILTQHSISQNTYKSHMKHIYSKTIDESSLTPGKSHGKLQRLTWFLMNLQNRNQN